MSASKVREAEKMVQQLKYEASKRERIMVSKACKELLDFCSTQEVSDYLLNKPKNIPNPYPQNKGCPLL